ncbi:hypothetical protein [Rhizobium sp. L1K21]|uniref:hypothetical protein n=1 Tax=Rhizobium sp. L1K21 TaxID=2954933 RepID=UPI002092CA73|nr:hypothetical protein [Rhizobium sp. L1K21]MCO6187934.1 hypothetical protein [Rhizobium sp. L1K21]
MFKLGITLAVLVASVLFTLTIWPDLLFFYDFRDENIILRSDEPIPPEAINVLKDVERRLERSALPLDGPYKVYICNKTWKLSFFGRRTSTNFGGVSDVYLSRNIYIRPADIRRNSVLPPASWRFSMADRPLSYFIAHEITHIQQVEFIGVLRYLQTPAWLLEGYADHIGKGKNLDIGDSRKALQDGAPEMDPKNGLYTRYQLAVELLLREKSFMELVEDPPDPESVLRLAK